ncbi:MAG: type 1 glutamine amidotransferase [Actinomycetota bacterium]|nr:type 1 glutamine amidotransferase [Actinomycetota bacterium]
MRALAIVHETDTGPGVFAEAALARGVRIDRWLIAQEASPPAVPEEYDAVISFGGSQNADQVAQHRWLETENAVLERLLEREVPLLGVCLGAQLLAQAAGGAVRPAAQPEIGWREVRTTDAGREDPVIGALGPRFPALEWHSYEFLLPPRATSLARSDACLQACRIGERAWGIQFHAEVTLADYESWIDQYRDDLLSAPIGLSADQLREQTRRGIEAWNDLGRCLCGRFLDTARRP